MRATFIKAVEERNLRDLRIKLAKEMEFDPRDHYCKVAKFVLKEKAEKMDQEEQEKARSREQNNDAETYTIGRKTIYGGVTLGGAVVTAASFFVEKAALRIALSSLGVAGLVIGGALLLRELNKK